MGGSVTEDFAPKWSGVLPYTSAAANVTFASSQMPTGNSIHGTFYNAGQSNSYLGSGSSGVAAVVSTSTPAQNSHCLPPGAIETLDFGAGNTLSAISSAGATGNIFYSLGEGS